jgi:ferredoxin
MRIKVDFDLCESNALCEAMAPEVFELDDDEQLIIKVPNPGDDLLPKVQKAVDRCPKNALALQP